MQMYAGCAAEFLMRERGAGRAGDEQNECTGCAGCVGHAGGMRGRCTGDTGMNA